MADRSRLTLFSLMVSSFSTYPFIIVTSVLLVEISSGVGVPLGMGGQIRAVYNTSAFIFSFASGVLSSRVSYRRLLLAGLVALLASSLVSGFASGFSMLLAAGALSGLGIALVSPMTTTIVAELYEEPRRSHVIGYLAVAGGSVFLLGGVTAGKLSELGGWRLGYLGFAGVISLVGLLLTWWSLPDTGSPGGQDVLAGFREVLGSRGAVGCLLGNLFSGAAIQGLYYYSFSYLKEVFGLSTMTAGFVYSLTSAFFIAGSYVTGRAVERVGSRAVTAAGTLMFTLCSVGYHLTPSLGATVALVLAGNLFESLRFSASNSLSLMQVEGHKGTMMSLNSAATNLGYSVGASVGGYILLTSGWRLMGYVYGVFGFAATAATLLLVKEN